MKNQKVFTTRDLYMAASLISLKFFMQGVDYQVEGDKTVGYFNFEDNEKLREAIHKFRQRMLVIEPNTLFASMRELKSEVTTRYKRPNNPNYSD